MNKFRNMFELNRRGLTSTKKWERICKAGNIILSVLYVPGGLFFGFLGIMFLSLGSSDISFNTVCYYLAAILFLLTPVFSILGIVFSVIYRRKKRFADAFRIQFLPIGILGYALVFFLLSVFIK